MTWYAEVQFRDTCAVVWNICRIYSVGPKTSYWKGTSHSLPDSNCDSSEGTHLFLRYSQGMTLALMRAIELRKRGPHAGCFRWCSCLFTLPLSGISPLTRWYPNLSVSEPWTSLSSNSGLCSTFAFVVTLVKFLFWYLFLLGIYVFVYNSEWWLLVYKWINIFIISNINLV